jgi:uncharacterized protein with PIN domain
MADNMLGTLAKWLRVAGADCEYAGGMDDDELLEVALGGRFLLTRDKELAHRSGEQGMYVASDVLEDQLVQVLTALPDLLNEEPLTRCLICNIEVRPVVPDEVVGDVPDGILERHDELWMCPECERVYWMGTHFKDMVERLRDLREMVEGVPGLRPD